jgi:hypothetical protein
LAVVWISILAPFAVAGSHISTSNFDPWPAAPPLDAPQVATEDMCTDKSTDEQCVAKTKQAPTEAGSASHTSRANRAPKTKATSPQKTKATEVTSGT